MKFEKDKLCSSCEKGKQTKSSFKPKSCSSITEPFHLLHMDLFGTIPIKSKSGKMFTLVIVDDFLRFTWVVFPRKKNHVAEEIVSFIKQYKVLYDHRVGQLRSDHGIEFVNSNLEE